MIFFNKNKNKKIGERNIKAYCIHTSVTFQEAGLSKNSEGSAQTSQCCIILGGGKRLLVHCRPPSSKMQWFKESDLLILFIQPSKMIRAVRWVKGGFAAPFGFPHLSRVLHHCMLSHAQSISLSSTFDFPCTCLLINKAPKTYGKTKLIN